ncbi:MAG: hypothetical protein WC796_03615 [Candidatus Pacearchaeota archaeon]|jgi:hypothetical protein
MKKQLKKFLELKIVTDGKGMYVVKYKKGQKEFFEELAKMADTTLDSIIQERIEQATGVKTIPAILTVRKTSK